MLAFAENTIQLVPDGTLLFHFALIIVMVVILNLTLLKPINKVLEERERRAGGKLSEAKEILLNAEEKARLWETGLRGARTDAYRSLEKDRAEALREREQRLVQVKAELTELVAKQKSEILQQEKQAQAELEAEAKRLADLIGTRVLGRRLG
jgi:F-type H+-transporting ATPase subunit b